MIKQSPILSPRRPWRKWLLLSVTLAACLFLFSSQRSYSGNAEGLFYFGESKTNNVPRHLDLSDINDLVKRDEPSEDVDQQNEKSGLGVTTWKKPFNEKYKPINKLSSSNFKGASNNIGRPYPQEYEHNKLAQQRNGILEPNNNNNTPDQKQNMELSFQDNKQDAPLETFQNFKKGALNQEKPAHQISSKEKLKAILSSKSGFTKKEKIAALEAYRNRMRKLREEETKNYIPNENAISQEPNGNREVLIGSDDNEEILTPPPVQFDKKQRVDYSEKLGKDAASEITEDLPSSQAPTDTVDNQLKASLSDSRMVPDTHNRDAVGNAPVMNRMQHGEISQEKEETSSSIDKSSTYKYINIPSNPLKTSLSDSGRVPGTFVRGSVATAPIKDHVQQGKVFQDTKKATSSIDKSPTPENTDLSSNSNARDEIPLNYNLESKHIAPTSSTHTLSKDERLLLRKKQLLLLLKKAKEKRLTEKKEKMKLLLSNLKEKLSKKAKTMEESLHDREKAGTDTRVDPAILLNKLRGTKVATETQEKKNEPRLPTLYELYSHGHIQSGLTVESSGFLLNGKPLRIMSGTIHYFRVHPSYWRDRLRKLRAAGFNTITTDIPWNFHQKFKGTMDFSSRWRDIREFINIAKEEDLFVILRVGPYISAEWDLGGLPHWLLQDEEIKIRTPQPLFFKPASEYLKLLSKLLVDLQWSKQNGPQPLLMIQIENEFLIVSVMADRDKRYLMTLKNTMVDAGLSDVLYVITNPANQICKERLVPGIFQAVSFSGDPTFPFFMLSHTQPDTPKLVMTFQTGGFDRFTDKRHYTDEVKEFRTNLEWILSNGSSVNLYMFHGGTTFGFMNGGSRLQKESFYKPGVTSYDYDAPLTESGDYTPKYWASHDLAKKYHVGPEIWNPQPPPETVKKAYPSLQVQHYLSLDDIVSMLPEPVPQFNPKPMEFLDLHDGSGQGHGFILYRKESVIINPYSVLKINGIIRDIMYIFIDGKLISSPLTSADNINAPGYWVQRNPQFDLSGDGAKHRIDLLVESMGRDNLEMSNGRKGIRGTVMLDEAPLNYWHAYPIEFFASWINKIPKWRQFYAGTPITSPGLYKANLRVSDSKPSDTFLNPFDKRSKWTKGQIFINGFNLGRYWDVGPTKTSYIPAPLLRTGDNQILLFEIYKPGNFINFEDSPTLG